MFNISFQFSDYCCINLESFLGSSIAAAAERKAELQAWSVSTESPKWSENNRLMSKVESPESRVQSLGNQEESDLFDLKSPEADSKK